MKDIIRKLCKKVTSEWPAFKKLISLTTRLITRKVPKEEMTTTKSEIYSLFAQSRVVVGLAVGCFVIFCVLLFRGCGAGEMTPPRVVQAFYEEIEKLPSKPSMAELKKIEDAYCNGRMAPTPEWISVLGATISQMKSQYNVKRSIRERYSERGDRAKVLIDCSIRVYGKSVTWVVPIELEKVDGKWLISNNPLIEEDTASKNAVTH